MRPLDPEKPADGGSPELDLSTALDVPLDTAAHWLDVWLAKRLPDNMPLVGGARRKSLAIVVLALGMAACQFGVHVRDMPMSRVAEIAGRAIGGNAAAAPTPFDVPGLR